MKNASVLEKQPALGIDPGQIQEINSAALRGVTPFLRRLPPAYAQQFVGQSSVITEAVAAALELLLPKRIIIPHPEAERWQKYYRDWYGITCSLGETEIPTPHAYPARLILMHADVSNRPQRIASVYKKRCADKWWQWTDNLNAGIPQHIRSGTYGIWVADVSEAPDGFDEEQKKNLSSQDTWDRGWITTTLPERLVDGDVYLLERKEHLDRTVITLCPGSRDVGGVVPSVGLDGDGDVGVRGWDPGDAGGSLRFRRAIV
ncbi:MAG: hypothetical protein HYV67_01420 [Candidatus Taylorbacteria bacterium]|nr:hypothetical protein [Candidatus Taylorbacteria bacterium]